MPTRISGQKVRSIMLSNNVTPSQLASTSELSPSTIDRILNDRASNYSNYTVQRLATALHCSPFDLFTEQAINTTLADSAATAVAEVVAEAVTEAVSVVVDEVAPHVSPEQVAEAVPNMSVNAPPVLDISSYFAYIQQSHRDELESLAKARDNHLADLRRERDVWRTAAIVFAVVLVFALMWAVTH